MAAIFEAYALLVPQVQARINGLASISGLTSFKDAQLLWPIALSNAGQQLEALGKAPQSLGDVVNALVKLTDFIELGLGRHMNAVGWLAMRIASYRGESVDFIARCGMGGQLHDIGKVVMPAGILRKPSHLTPDEYAAIKLHADAGDHLLRGTPMLANLAEIVRGHHERIDGQGYPDRLRGFDIRLESRIIAVADAFDAMTAERVYRDPISTLEAAQIIVCESGSHFDPEIVKTFLDVIQIPRRAVA